MRFKTPEDRNTFMMFNQLEDWVDSDNIVRLIDRFVDLTLTKKKFEYDKGKSEFGRKAYSANTLLKLYLYGYLNRISSSRRLETECNRNMEVIFLLGNLRPDFKTIADFRKDNKSLIRMICLEFRRFLVHEKFIKGEKIAYDGTKIKACTSKRMLEVQLLSKRLAHLEKEMEAYFNQLDSSDKKEDHEDKLIDLETMESELMSKIAQLEKEIHKLQGQKDQLQNKGIDKEFPGDTEAKFMLTRDGIKPAFNVQGGVDNENKMIVIAEVTDRPNDYHEIENLVSQTEEELSITPKLVEADKGYGNPDQIQKLESTKIIRCSIPLKGYSSEEQRLRDFKYIKEKDVVRCKNHIDLKYNRKRSRQGHVVKIYKANASDCLNCPFISDCTKSENGREYWLDSRYEWITAYKRRMDSKRCKAEVIERKAIIEHVFGTLKRWMGKVPFLMKGKEKAQIEIDIYTTAYNMLRLKNIVGVANAMSRLELYYAK
ncbi:MAG: IS1182 family transposase [Bacteroidales bacterium]